MRPFYDRGALVASHHLKLAFPQQLTRTLVGAGVGGALGAGVGALTGQSADPNDPLSTGTRGRNALIGGGLGAVLGGGAGFMADNGSVRPTNLITTPPKGPSALQLGAARSQSYENLGGASMHDPSALSGAATGMGNLDRHVEQANAAATQAAFPKTREMPLIPVATGNRGYYGPPPSAPVAGDEALQSMADRLSVGHKLGAAFAAEKLALMPSQLQHAAVGAGIGGLLGAGVGAFTGSPENRQRNMVRGGLGGAVLGGAAGLAARPSFGDHVMSQPLQLLDANPVTHAPQSGASFARESVGRPRNFAYRAGLWAGGGTYQPQVSPAFHESYDAMLKGRGLRDVYEGVVP